MTRDFFADEENDSALASKARKTATLSGPPDTATNVLNGVQSTHGKARSTFCSSFFKGAYGYFIGLIVFLFSFATMCMSEDF